MTDVVHDHFDADAQYLFHACSRGINVESFLDRSAWRGYRREGFPAESWAWEGDSIRALAHGPRVDLVSKGSFGDFDLSFEWRLPVGGNSGLLYRVVESADAAWQSGPEMQLVDNSTHPDGRVPETSCGALYALYPAESTLCCPAGLFNIARVSTRGSRIEHWLNGTRVLVCDLAGEDFRQRVAGSKFHAFPDFARAAEGHLVLQHHGSDAWFRNIRIGEPIRVSGA
jgi:Domain of Unknown Function (DUF1080)